LTWLHYNVGSVNFFYGGRGRGAKTRVGGIFNVAALGFLEGGIKQGRYLGRTYGKFKGGNHFFCFKYKVLSSRGEELKGKEGGHTKH